MHSHIKVQPYKFGDLENAKALFKELDGSFEEYGVNLKFSEEPVAMYHYDTDIELFEKTPNTLVVSHKPVSHTFSIGLTPGLGSSTQKSIIISTLEGYYETTELVGVAWHEIGDNILGLDHHDYNPEDECAMQNQSTREELDAAVRSGEISPFLKDLRERYKKVPTRFCEKCEKKIKVSSGADDYE